MQNDWVATLRSDTDQAGASRHLEDIRQYLRFVARTQLDSRLARKVDASDIAQHSMMDVQKDIRSFNGESDDELRRWLHRLVCHNVRDYQRKFFLSKKRNLHQEQELSSDHPSSHDGDLGTPSRLLAKSELEVGLATALSRIPSADRQLIELKYRRGMSVSKIAILFGVSDYEIRKKLAQTIRSLRKELDDFS